MILFFCSLAGVSVGQMRFRKACDRSGVQPHRLALAWLTEVGSQGA